MYRKQEWESSSRLNVIPRAQQGPEDHGSEGHGTEGNRPKPHPDGVPPRPMAEARVPVQPSSVDIAPVGAKRPQRHGKRTLLIGTALLLAAGAAGWFGYDWWTVGRFTVSTDDAYVG